MDAIEETPQSLLRFSPVVCTLDLGFWRIVNSAKLNQWRLETPQLAVRGTLVALQPSFTDVASRRSRGWRLHLAADAFRQSEGCQIDSVQAQEDCMVERSTGQTDCKPAGSSFSVARSFQTGGIFFNSNSAEDFRLIDRNHFIEALIQPLKQRLLEARNIYQNQSQCPVSSNFLQKVADAPVPHLLLSYSVSQNFLSNTCPFLILAFADLKSHLYYYNVAVPSLRPSIDFLVSAPSCPPVWASDSQPVGADHLAAVGNALFDSEATRQKMKGKHCGVCVLVRKRSTDKQGTDWLSSFISESSNAALSSALNIVRLDTSTVLVPLSHILSCISTLPYLQFTTNRKLLVTEFAEAMVCVGDSSYDDATFGWPLRSLLFCLGFLGFSDGQLPLLVFRGPSQSASDSSTSNITQSNRILSFSSLVAMPEQAAFQLDSAAVAPTELSTSLPSSSNSPKAQNRNESQNLSHSDPSRPSIVAKAKDVVVPGWLRRTDEQKTSITFLVDLRRHLNSMVSQADAVQLNVRLIKWRILPALDSFKLQNLRFLLFGVGTLGCNILRNLVAWGITQFTLVDCGRVALSSPVRQSLFTHDDAIWNNGRGRLKVHAAKKRLLEVRPDLSINAVPLDIPMPGHPRYLATFQRESDGARMSANSSVNENRATLGSSITFLERLIDAHDVVLLLTDSRESRWLPSMLISTTPFRRKCKDSAESTTPPLLPQCSDDLSIPQEGLSQFSSVSDTGCPDDPWGQLFASRPTFEFPLCITVALGFDSFVVMRHGQRRNINEAAQTPPLLACYFCNDLTAPFDSIARRPLDQQCTVTRPGISGLASSVASELIAALSQHPEAPDPPHSSIDHGTDGRSHSCLGATPHTVRGSLGDFRLVCTETESFQHCICCSAPIAQKFCSEEKVSFVAEALARSEILEEISGLAAMKACHREDEVMTFGIDSFDSDDEATHDGL